MPQATPCERACTKVYLRTAGTGGMANKSGKVGLFAIASHSSLPHSKGSALSHRLSASSSPLHPCLSSHASVLRKRRPARHRVARPRIARASICGQRMFGADALEEDARGR